MYDKNYFENGAKVGVSCYENYRWLPDLTLPMCSQIISKLGISPSHRVLDYGCAKGFLVRAFHELGVPQTFGVDISEYAISNCDENVRKHLTRLSSATESIDIHFGHNIDWLLCKDVLEHVSYNDLPKVLSNFFDVANNVFIAVPLGDGHKYNVPDYELDVTHIIREDLGWWENVIKNAGYKVTYAKTKFDGVKDNWAHFQDGNGFFIATKEIT